MILCCFGTNFHEFCCPGDWLEIWSLFKVTLGSPQILRPARWMLNCQSRSLVTTIPGSLKLAQVFLRPRLGVSKLSWEYMGYMTHWKRDCRLSFAALCSHKGRRRISSRRSAHIFLSISQKWMTFVFRTQNIDFHDFHDFRDHQRHV